MTTAKKKLYYKIGEACKALDIQPYVLRYWETEFSMLNPGKSKSGQRVYNEGDLETIRRIKELLYEEGFTIAGAKKRLEAELAKRKPQPKAQAVGPAAKSAAAAPKPKAKAAKPAKKASAKKAPARKSRATALDSGNPEALKTLHRKAEAALREAKEILALLDGDA